MKVYLLNPPYFPRFIRSARWQDTGRGGTLYYPVWLAYACGFLEQYYETRLVDAPAWNWDRQRVIEDVRSHRPDVIVVDSSFPSLKNDVTVAGFLKEVSGATTVMVGPPAALLSERILADSAVDVVARMEYEHTLLHLVRTLEKGGRLETVPGISYRSGGRIRHNADRGFTADLDEIPFVSRVYRRHLDIRDYFLGSSLYPMVQIFTGRGCPYLCTFCSWPETLMGRKYRVRSVKNVLDELEWIQANLPGVREVFFEDDTFTVSSRRVAEFCTGYRQRRLRVAWACNARATLDPEIMKEMKRAGCRLLIVGYESGSDEILKNIRKGITTDDIRNFARAARRAGLLVHGDFIIGLPRETRETVASTVRLIREVRPDILQVSVASPFPGTWFYRWARENGYLVTDDPGDYLDDQGHQRSVVSYPWLSAEEIAAYVDCILRDYYLSVRYVPLAFRQVFRRNGLYELIRLGYSARKFLSYIRGRWAYRSG
jgi:radical SAM superfamily enzyme YgiQ (UPF0313 family)